MPARPTSIRARCCVRQHRSRHHRQHHHRQPTTRRPLPRSSASSCFDSAAEQRRRDHRQHHLPSTPASASTATSRPNGILIQNNDITNIDATDRIAAGVDFEPSPALDDRVRRRRHRRRRHPARRCRRRHARRPRRRRHAQRQWRQRQSRRRRRHRHRGLCGRRSGYAVTYVTDADGRVVGFTSVTDNNAGNGDEGADTLTSIEVLEFDDVTIDLGRPGPAVRRRRQAGRHVRHDPGRDRRGGRRLHDPGRGRHLRRDLDVNKDVTIIGPNVGIEGTDGARGAEAVIKASTCTPTARLWTASRLLGGTHVAGNPTAILGRQRQRHPDQPRHRRIDHRPARAS